MSGKLLGIVLRVYKGFWGIHTVDCFANYYNKKLKLANIFQDSGILPSSQFWLILPRKYVKFVVG
jgi:hypothetical protein